MKIKISESKLRDMIKESINKAFTNDDTLNEGWKNKAAAALMGLTMATTMPSCRDNVFHNEPTSEVSYADQQYAKFDWNLITDEENQGFIYDMYTGCANGGSRHIACIIQKDKYCWRYYVPSELEDEIAEKYRNQEVVDISQLEPFIGWRGYQ